MAPKNPIETYFKDLHEIRSTGGGTKETSYYAPLENLLNALGGKLKPKVRAVSQLANAGAGHPDYGLYAQSQFQKARDDEPLPGQSPERGVIEAKPTDDDSWVTAKGKQVSKYWGKYRQVLVTNYRDFVLIGQDVDGNSVKLETLRLAANEKEFWLKTRQPRKFAEDIGERFADYLVRVLRYSAPLTSPQDLAWFLASYAREALHRVEDAGLEALDSIKMALEQTLGLEFSGDRGEHFFRSTLVQTLFYGLFSAWVLWSQEHPPADKEARFRWKEAMWTLHVPMIQALFERVATPSKLKPLDLVELLDWTETALNRVDRASFFSVFDQGQAVQYFYEPFLEAFDPTLRKELGVWYTPSEIVQYMVARVDQVLKSELNLKDGLADSQVYVLDPCCGTGAYLAEVIRTIEKTLRDKGGDDLVAYDLKKAATERVFGFEILTAPFVVAHMQIGLLLQQAGAPLATDGSERAGVYLTNALTGWEPPKEPKDRLPFPEFELEREAADRVKQETPILVILGNPPYNAFAGTSPAEEQGLVDVYKEGLNKPVKDGGWGIKKFNLDELYVRFFRLAERRIAEVTGRGVVCFISNFSYLGDPSFVVMRQKLLKDFDKIWIDCLNGDSRETGKLTPDGKPDPSVFSTEYNRVGIRVGTAVTLFCKQPTSYQKGGIKFRQFWGVSKKEDLLHCISSPKVEYQYIDITPTKNNRYSLRPLSVSKQYNTWPKIYEVFKKHFNGPVERRGLALISIDRKPLRNRMKNYFDLSVTNNEIEKIYPSLMMSGNRIVGPDAREKITDKFSFNEERIVNYPFKPFDVRNAYLDNLRPLFSEPSPELISLGQIKGNAFLITRDTADKTVEGPPFLFSQSICDYDSISGHARHFPIYLSRKQKTLKDQKTQVMKFVNKLASGQLPKLNLSNNCMEYCNHLGIRYGEATKIHDELWMHILSIGYSPQYLQENEDGIKSDWPRIPLPNKRELLESSADIGRKLAVLLEPTSNAGSAMSRFAPLLNTLGNIRHLGEGPLDPDKGHLAITAGWGHAGQNNVTMPGRGDAREREYDPEELTAISETAKKLGITDEQAFELLGQTTYDIYLNELACWKNVPSGVWNYYIGGYQVIKKWLSYREKKLLGRNLKPEEARYVTDVFRRLASIVLMGPELDDNYQKVKTSCFDWQSLSDSQLGGHMSLSKNQKTRVLALLQDYLASKSGEDGLPPAKSNAELDRKRTTLISEELGPLVLNYLAGSVPLAEFKSKIDSINKRNNFWGFKGIKGQMFFNMMVNVADDEEECSQELKSAIALPQNDQIASSRIKTYVSYVKRLGEQWVDAGNTRYGCPKTGSIPFFLSWFWQVQGAVTWPVYYTAGVNALNDLNLWQPTGDLANDYLSFKQIHEELRELFISKFGRPATLYDVEHVLWFKVGNPYEACKDTETKSLACTPMAHNEPTLLCENEYLPSSYVPPIVSILPQMALNDEKLVAAAKRSGTSLERAFEKHTDASFSILGFETKLLGQGAGRVPDGLVLAHDESYAILWDAKIRANGYSLGTDDRIIKEYINSQSRELKKKRFLRNIYYVIISSHFADDYDDAIRSLKMETDISEVSLLEAEALVAMVDAKMRAPLFVTLGPDGLQRIFAMSGILSADLVREQLN